MSTMARNCEETSPDERKFRLRSSLMLAISSKDVRAVRALAASVDPTLAGVFHEELPRAIRTGAWPVVLAVLEGFARVVSPVVFQSPLCIAAEEGQLDIMARLIERGEQVDETRVGATPLMGAVQADCPPAIDLLLSHGATACLPGSGRDPFFHACSMGKRVSAFHLVDAGVLDGVAHEEWEAALASIDERTPALRHDLRAHIAARLAGQIDAATLPANGRTPLPRL